jgi:hypothetical protein
MLSMKPFVVFAIKVMAPGPRRVSMVKLAHAMSDARSDIRSNRKPSRMTGAAPQHHPQGVATSRRAA